MASISSSLKTLAETMAEVDLALVAEGAGDAGTAVLPLAAEWPAGDLDMGSVLVDRAAYRFSLLARGDVEGARACVALPGQDAEFAVLGPVEKYVIAGDGNRWAWHRLALECDEKPFKLAFGVVTVDVALTVAGSDERALRTRPVPCTCTIPRLRDHVSGLLRSLRSPQAAAALALMSSPGDGAAAGEDAGQPAESFLALADKTAGVVEAALPALRLRPFARMGKTPAVVRASSARRAGRAEAQWLARNPSQLARRDGGGWDVLKVATMQPARALAVEENLAVLALAADVARQSAALSRAFEGAVSSIESNMAQMPALAGGEGLMPAQLILAEHLDIVRARRDAAAAIAARARRCQHELERCWGVSAPGRFSLPRRSKPFQEIDHYARLFSAMAEWSRAGRADVARETAILSADSMPRLYELFCLERILSWLLAAGFTAVETQRMRYSLRSPHFQNERAVANRYVLARGDERAELWYQPVIYGDARDESGLGLHRTCAARTGNVDSYWTPDFVLRTGFGSTAGETLVIDSKWADGSAARGLLAKCVEKYTAGIAGEGGLRTDAVVVLCGRGGESDAWRRPLGSWARESGMVPDSICPLTPFTGSLDDVLGPVVYGDPRFGERDGLGCGAGDGTRASAAGNVPCIGGAGARGGDGGDGTRAGFAGGRPRIDMAADEDETKGRKSGPAEKDGGSARRGRDGKSASGTGAGGQREPNKGSQPELDPDLAALLLQLMQRPQDLADVQDAQLSQDLFLIEYPLVKLKKPTGVDRKRYTSTPYQACGQDVYLYKRWRPNQLNRLKLAIKRWDKRAAAPRKRR